MHVHRSSHCTAPASSPAAPAAPAAPVTQALATHLADARRGEAMRSGLRVALMGPPNSGKSSLLNALAGRPAAIVSPVAGTTRDAIEVTLQLAGYSVTVAGE